MNDHGDDDTSEYRDETKSKHCTCCHKLARESRFCIRRFHALVTLFYAQCRLLAAGGKRTQPAFPV